FAYFFLDENCSHLNLAILEVVKPEWDLLSKFPLTVIPLDTVRAVAEIPGAVASVRQSPNLKQELAGRLSVLTTDELARLAVWRETGEFKLDGSETAPLLDAWLTERKLKTIREKKGDLSPSESELRHQILLARAKAPGDPQRAVPASTQTSPDSGHRNGKFWSGVGFANGAQAGWVLGHRFAYHDLLDADPGHLPFSEIEVVGIEASYQWAREAGVSPFRFNRLRLLRSTSLNPVDLTGSPWSWHLSIGGERIALWNGRTPMVADFQFALGKSAYLGVRSRRALVFALARLGFQGNGVFAAGVRGGPGLWLGIISSPVPRLKWLVDLEALWNPWQPIAQGGRTVWRLGVGVGASLAQNWELRGESKIEAGFQRVSDFGWESSVRLARYY
ncbi:MAG: DUF4105 domain-containing protein, partial [Bdellovibrionota bacterium]